VATEFLIGTRGSQLATTQSGMVRDQLAAHWQNEIDPRLEIISTKGDVDSTSLSQIGGQGVFTREIERALLDSRVQLAVHSLKDLPTDMDERLQLSAIPVREDIRDVLVTADGGGLDQLPDGARIGTGSSRRQAQLLAIRPDLQFADLRGNVDTRLGKVTHGELDAVVLAAAGLHRLGHGDRISCYLDPNQILPAPGQGALGLQTLKSDSVAHRLLSALNDPATHTSVTAERAFLASLGGGCRAPIAAWARMEGEQLRLDGAVLSLDGATVCRGTLAGNSEDATRLGAQLGEQLKAEGALALMADAG
jgi:hydroxymethylbilane synthase